MAEVRLMDSCLPFVEETMTTISAPSRTPFEARSGAVVYSDASKINLSSVGRHVFYHIHR